MSSYLELLSKFLNDKALPAALAVTALCIVLLNVFGPLSDLYDPLAWVIMIGLLGFWMFVFDQCKPLWKMLWTKSISLVRRKQQQTEQIAKLEILTEEQWTYMVWLKGKDKRHFQAWDNDDTVNALRRMGLLIAHEHTDDCYSRYEVPIHIWPHIHELDEEQRSRLSKETPWAKKLRTYRI